MWNGTGARNTDKNEVFIGLQHENCCFVGEQKFGGGIFFHGWRLCKARTDDGVLGK